jgi:hypothetical protein
MDFTNDNRLGDEGSENNGYDADTTLAIKGALFELLKEVERDVCFTCGKHLNLNHAFIYDHDGGWVLVNGLPKQWVSIQCSCGYHNSLNKLGVRYDR